MLDLSPTKLLIVFIVVVVLLGPKRLPEVARQLGAGWRKLRDLHGKLDTELRKTVPDLPSSQEIVRFARSPITLLNQLADRTGVLSSHEGAGTAAGVEVAGNGVAGNGVAGNGVAGNGVAGNGVAGNGAAGNGAAAGDGIAAGDGAGLQAAAPTRVARARPTSNALETDDPNLN